MAALPFYLLACLGAYNPDSLNPGMVKVDAGDFSIILGAKEFVWEEAATLLLAGLADSGYPFAGVELGGSRLAADTLVLNARIHKGPLVTVTGIGFRGEYKTNPRLLAHLSGFEPFTFSCASVDELSAKLQELDVKVLDWQLVTRDGVPDSAARLYFLAEEAKNQNRAAAFAGYSQAEGLVGRLEVGFFNLFGGRRRVSLYWQRLARYNLSYSATARDPYFLYLPFGIEAQAMFRSFDESTYHLEVSADAFITRGRFETGLGYAYQEDRSSGIRIMKNLAFSRLKAGPFNLKAAAGQRVSESSSAYLEAQAQAAILVPLFGGFGFYFQPNAGGLASPDSLLASELLPVGGAQSLRGYAEEQYRTRSLVYSRQELRWGSQAFSLYPLLDAGWIPDEGFLAGYGAGTAVRTPVGRLELDAALPVDGTWNQAKLHLSLDATF